MAVLEIVKIGDPALEERAQEVPRLTKRISKLIDDMLETMYAANGVGLAAPQIGVGQRIIVLDVGEGPLVLINPQIKKGSGEIIDVEGCLSVPERWVYVKRLESIVVQGRDEKGKTVRIEAEGLLARALQHEIDHLDGILILHRMLGEVQAEQGKEVGE